MQGSLADPVPASGATSPRPPTTSTPWRWFPRALLTAVALVFAVNATMVWTAVRTFPGEAGTDGFDLSNDYDRVLTANARQQALGWQLEVTTEAARPVLHLTAPASATIEATAERPLGAPERTTITFRPAAADRYETRTTLPPGQWDLLLTIRADGQQLTATRRLTVK